MNSFKTNQPRLHVEDRWAHFDSMPRELKEIFWYCAGPRWSTASLDSSPKHLAKLRARVAELESRLTLDTYGPDHPQAERGTEYAEATALLRSCGLE